MLTLSTTGDDNTVATDKSVPHYLDGERILFDGQPAHMLGCLAELSRFLERS